jgi:hypothetical protein
VLAACGGSSSTPQHTLHSYLAAWSHGDWAAMRKLVATPPATFTTANARAFSALGVTSAAFGAGRVTQKGSKASARVTERFALPHAGTWSTATVVHLVQRNDAWKVAWTPATINPALGGGSRLATIRDWPRRAAITGAGGAPLTADKPLVTVGVVGGRIRDARAVGADLVATGAPAAQVKAALAQAKAHPSFFEPVFQVTPASSSSRPSRGPTTSTRCPERSLNRALRAARSPHSLRRISSARWGRSPPSS